MHKLETMLSGPLLLAPTVHGDERGFFPETYRRSTLAELGVEDHFVQDKIDWPDASELIGSERDRSAPTVAQRKNSLPSVHADA